MQPSDRTGNGEVTDAPARPGIAALLAAGLLLAASAGRWDKLVYPHYFQQIAFQCAVLLLLMLWAFPRKAPRSIGRRDVALVAPYIAYGIYTLLSCVWAFNPRLALVGGAVQVIFPLVWAIGLGMLLRSREDVRTILRAAFVAGVIAAFASFYYVVRDGSLESVLQVQGQRNFLATFLIPPMIIGLSEVFSTLRTPHSAFRILGWPRWLVLAGMLAMAVSMTFVFFRSVGALMGLAAAVVCLLSIRLSWRRRLVIAGVALFLVAAALAVCSARPAPVNAWMMKHSSVATRWFMWQGAVRMIGDRPLTGWGPGNFMLRFADYKPTEPMQYGWLGNFTIYPHNELLLVLAEGGLLALVLYLAGHALVAFRLLNPSSRDNLQKPEIPLLAWTLFAAALGMFVHAQVEVTLRFWAPSAMFWTLIGLMIAVARSPRLRVSASPRLSVLPDLPIVSPRLRVSASPRLSVPHLALFAATLIFVVALAVGVVWSGARAEWLLGAGGSVKGATLDEFVQTRAEAARLSRYVPDGLLALEEKAGAFWGARNLSAAIESYEQLERMAPGCRRQWRQALGELYFLRAREIGSKDENAAVADLNKAAVWLDLAIRQNPYNAAPRLLLARVMRTASIRNLPAAAAQVRAAVEGEPNNPEAHFLLGALLADAGQKEEALAELDKAAALSKPASDLAERIRTLKLRIETAPSLRE